MDMFSPLEYVTNERKLHNFYTTVKTRFSVPLPSPTSSIGGKER